MSNPFLSGMVKLQVPDGMSTSLSVAGFSIEADKERCVEVPQEHVATLKAHGLVDAPVAAAKGK